MFLMCTLGILYSICESMSVCQALCQETFFSVIFNPPCFYHFTLSYKPTQHAVQCVCTENPVIFAEILKLQVNATWPNSANWSKLPKFNYVSRGLVNTKT